MTTHKRNVFGESENQLANIAKALSHPARIAILKEIARRQTCICGEIVEVIPLAQSTVSQHLKELSEAGLIKGTVNGSKSCYCINWDAFRRFGELFNTFFTETEISATNQCC